MNLSDLQAECARLLSDVGNNRWSTSVLTTRLNIAQQVVQGYTNAIRSHESISVTAGTGGYVLNTNTMDIIRIYKVASDGTAKPLPGITRDELDYSYPDWNNWDDQESKFFIYDATNQIVNLVPAPDSSISLISVYESRKPADMVSSTDLPFDSNNQIIPYHITLCHWVVAQCFSDDGTQEALVKAKFHRSGNMLNPGEFEKNLGRIMAEFDSPEAVPNNVLWKPQGARVGYSYWPQKSNPFIF